MQDYAPKVIPEGVYFLPTETWDKIKFFSPDIILTLLQVYKFFDKPEIL